MMPSDTLEKTLEIAPSADAHQHARRDLAGFAAAIHPIALSDQA